jgi:hypothetical protein
MKFFRALICRIGWHTVGEPHAVMPGGGLRYHCEHCKRVLTQEADGSGAMSDLVIWDGEKEISVEDLK